ncbi:MAG: NAD(P)/FAD-dependent oxidoreductase [Deltaproteobacteria bacterium]|jgi:dihydrolipoamide dehydrogenase|nr:NAD(P)/FAD-dependent oxidoreductase [Deltaproteobacteria bacterium]
MGARKLCILGAGPGGLSAAFEGLRLGCEVTLVERDLVGGTCLNRGCIPTKLYLGGTASLPLMRGAAAQKLAEGSIAFDLRNLKARKDRYIRASRQAMEKRLAAAGARLLFGAGRVCAPGRLEATTSEGVQTCDWDALILATGSHPASFPALAADHDCVLDSTDALELEEVPGTLLVVGGGAIGLEMADFFSRLGVKIILVEGCAQLAPAEDPELGEALRRFYEREGWEIHTGRQVSGLAGRQGKAVLSFADGEELCADKALLAVGRRPNSAGLGLETLGLVEQPGWLPVDECLRVAPGVYAVGDVNGGSLLAHAADHQARYAAAHAMGEIAGPYVSPPMPACIYGHVEVTRVGPSERELRGRGGIECSRANMVANSIAHAYCATQGFIKVYWDEGRVCAISALGHGVSHLVGMAGVIVAQGWSAEDVRRVIWAHPTLDEALEAALCAPREALLS